jgi:hypothetical protein
MSFVFPKAGPIAGAQVVERAVRARVTKSARKATLFAPSQCQAMWVKSLEGSMPRSSFPSLPQEY